MSSYRIYLVGAGAINGRQDFDADGDQNAIEVAHVLLDACQSFDLWQGTRRVGVPRLFEPTTFDELSAANQERVVHTEEMIVLSRWRIAESRRLLERLEAKRSVTAFRNAHD